VYSDADHTTVIGDHNGHMTQVLIKSDESDCWAGVTCSSHAPERTVVQGGPEFDNVENAGDAWGCIRTGLPCHGNGGLGSATLMGGDGADQLTVHFNSDFPGAPAQSQTISGGTGADLLNVDCTASDGSTETECPALSTLALVVHTKAFHPVLRAGRGADRIRDRIRGSVVYGGKGHDVCKVAKGVTTHGCEVVKHF
jgi:Ca2+-binding RTX toxin-like protein